MKAKRFLSMLLALCLAVGMAFAAVIPASAADALTDVLDYLAAQNTSPLFYSEWQVLALARGGKTVPDTYLSEVLKAVKAGELVSSTDYPRVVLALTAMGVDASDFAGYNLLESLADISFATSPLPNGPICALLAFGCHSAYEAPAGYAQTLIDEVLNQRLPDGSWTYGWAVSVDPDMTSMALQALAPYYDLRSDVKDAVDEAVVLLSNEQQGSGGFGIDWGYGGGLEENACSVAQVVTALSILGIDAAAFTNGGDSALDALLAYQNANGSFFSDWSAEDLMTTEQAAYALVAYSRFKAGANSLYDMTDVTLAAYVDTSALNAKIAAVEGTAKGNYTDASWNAFQDALTAAQSAATQAQVDSALANLNTTFAGLTLKTDYTALNAKINAVKDTGKGVYTDESWELFRNALTAAQNVAKNTAATQTEVNNALSALTTAYNGLKELSRLQQWELKLPAWLNCIKGLPDWLEWVVYYMFFGWIWDVVG